MVNPISIYKLTDPRGLPFCYVGCTSAPHRRLMTHSSACSAGRTKLSHWLKGLKEHGLRPVMTIVEHCEESEARTAEEDIIGVIRAIRGDYWCLNAAKLSPYRGRHRGVSPLVHVGQVLGDTPRKASVSAPNQHIPATPMPFRAGLRSAHYRTQSSK